MSLSRGTVAPGFESVREMFDEMLRSGCDTRAQLCVYSGEERILDLWGTAPNVVDETFGPDSIVNVFSSTKTITAIVVAKMVDDGLLSYDAKVVDYWPEFGANGKEGLTVADILRHEGGLTKFDTTLKVEDLTRQRIQENVVGAIVEKQNLAYRDGGDFHRREYHAITRGCILNEIVRRVDRRGRTIGEILRSDVCEPLGGVDAFVGLSPTEMGRVAPVQNATLGYITKQSLIPMALGREIDLNFFEFAGRMKFLRDIMKRATRQNHPPELELAGFGHTVATFNAEATRTAEIPSANGHASARGMAALASMMANDGAFQGVRLLSTSTVKSFHSEPIERDMDLGVTYFVKGGVSVRRPPTTEQPRPSSSHLRKLKPELGVEGCHGWGGLGGSVIQWHPEMKIGFGFVPTFLYWADITNVRGMKLLAEVIRCAKLKSGAAPASVS